MKEHITIIQKSGESVTLTLKSLDLTYLDQILQLQDEVVQGLPDKNWYVPTSKNDFIEYLSGKASVIGYVTPSNELVALGAYIYYGLSEHNYGYDLGITGEKLLTIGQIDSTIVKNSFRGHKLQAALCEALEELSQKDSITTICATVCPDNIYSLNTFLKQGYTIECEKLKYGGFFRYILAKNLILSQN